MSKYLILAGFFGFTGVALGAFGAHGLKDQLISTGFLDTWETATLYLFVHTLGITLMAAMSLPDRHRSVQLVVWFWSLGIVLFSGSLYLLSLTGISLLGAVTPFGGVLFLLGWGRLFMLGWSGRNKSSETF